MQIHQKNAIVTGAYGAIGKDIAAGIAAEGFRVTMVGRDKARLDSVQSLLRAQTSNPEIFFEAVDLSSKREIIEFSNKWRHPLHLLVNNAATAPGTRSETPEGIEMQWATNVLGYFWMIKYFHQFMEDISNARVVNVASYWAGGMDLKDPEFRFRQYDNDVAYRQAKQANRMLSASYASRLNSKGITVNACHPGDVNSKLSNAFGFGGSETPKQGAATPLYLSLSADLTGVTGKYYEHMRPVECQFSKDHDEVERLFELCSQKY